MFALPWADTASTLVCSSTVSSSPQKLQQKKQKAAQPTMITAYKQSFKEEAKWIFRCLLQLALLTFKQYPKSNLALPSAKHPIFPEAAKADRARISCLG